VVALYLSVPNSFVNSFNHGVYEAILSPAEVTSISKKYLEAKRNYGAAENTDDKVQYKI